MSAPHARVRPTWFFVDNPGLARTANPSVCSQARIPREGERRGNGPAGRMSDIRRATRRVCRLNRRSFRLRAYALARCGQGQGGIFYQERNGQGRHRLSPRTAEAPRPPSPASPPGSPAVERLAGFPSYALPIPPRRTEAADYGPDTATDRRFTGRPTRDARRMAGRADREAAAADWTGAPMDLVP
jgi:hypothetical protein